MKKWKAPEKKSLGQALKEKDSARIVHYALRFIVVLVLVAQLFNGNYENVFLCVLTLILFTIPSLIETNTRIDIPDTLENLIFFFIFAAEILGEMRSYYVTFPFWDTLLHTFNGFLAAAIGFSLVDILNQNERFSIRLSPFFVAIVAFCFSMTIGVMWEFFEFFMDVAFGLDMQKDTVIATIHSVSLDPTNSQKIITISGIEEVVVQGKPLGVGGYLDIGLFDTMEDLFVNFIGAVAFSIAGYFYVKYRSKKAGFLKYFVPTLVEKEESR
ncbi:hypothetical protein DYP60_01285 [Sphaerochaeta halotolerans]|uniref:Uncharacterized protein n=1 Tax=Sphaerochaeta halotolerans TaxID=2293840 RepID=A0A372MKQ0_9SPIR|nr:hypothetical protein [Sphaerochaeta halotolerans]RFU96304.1 hypothetical protein DYP60_01285 [Sphaerochaeta halotolerans]